MPSFTPWTPSARRQTSLAAPIHTNNTGDQNFSDTASVKGSINSVSSKSKWLPNFKSGAPPGTTEEPESQWDDANSSQTSLTLKEPAAINPTQKMLWNNRKRTKDMSSTVEEQVAKLKEENLAMAKGLRAVQDQLADREQELEKSKLHGVRMEQQYEVVVKGMEETKSEAIGLRQELEESKDHGVRLEEKNEALVGEADVLRNDLKATKDHIVRMEEEKEGITRETNALRDDLTKSKDHVARMEEQNEALRRALDVLRKDLSDSQDHGSFIGAGHEELMGKVKALQKDLKESRGDRDQMKKDRDNALRDKHNMQTKIREVFGSHAIQWYVGINC